MRISLTDAISKIEQGASLSADESFAAFAFLFEANPGEEAIRRFLGSLHQKGETAEELLGAVKYLRSQAISVTAKSPDLVDCCGTGGDHKNTFNISTAVSFVLAGAGCTVAKHGNRAITSTSGSADVLSALGVSLTLSPEQLGQCLDKVGIAFLFAPNHYPLLKSVASIRKSLPHRTIFNLLGPLLNPAGAKKQLIGLYDKTWCRPICEVLKALGSESVITVNSDDGSDEFTLTGQNHYARLNEQRIEEGIFDSTSTGYPICQAKALAGGTPEENAHRLRLVLKGHSLPLDHAVHLNAAWGLIAAQKVTNVLDGLLMAQDAISSGRAYQKLEALVEFTRSAC
jgi:anthranilate phosphoribosyltransferase